MANRTVNTEWNIYSAQERYRGWEQMQVPGTYERGIFGDLMLPGIACGVQKFILIFNTNVDSHDPIYVVDPRKFQILNIPIVLAYNLAHYESMHPSGEEDIQATIKLVQEFLNNTYRFKPTDLPFLLGTEAISVEAAEDKSDKINIKNKTSDKGEDLEDIHQKKGAVT